MIDSLRDNRSRATRPAVLIAALLDGERLLGATGYGLLMLHLPTKVDDPDMLRRLLDPLCELLEGLRLVFPVHPRTRARIEAAGRGNHRERGLLAMPSPGYLDMLGLMGAACRC
jgi:UDP-N-acetylglucosamine 2-epimerase (non-hydrolysing)